MLFRYWNFGLHLFNSMGGAAAITMKKISVLLLLMINFINVSISTDFIWPNKQSSFTTGDLYVAGFFPIHDIDFKLVCGKIEEEGLQQLETFLFTIDQINNDSSILPNITLGVLGLDSCDSSSHTLEVAMDHIPEFLISDPSFRDKLMCENGSFFEQGGIYQRLVGVIGGRSSRVSIQLANLLRVFKIPQISYKSNAPALSNKKQYEYFFRTVAPIVHQVTALLEIIKAFKWTYVSVVYSDSEYGNAGFESLQVLAARENICFATQQRVNLETFIDAQYDAILDELLKEKARAVVIFGEQLLAKNIMSACTRKKVYNRFVWLGSEAWGSRDYAVKGFEKVAEGILCVAYFIKPPPGFHDYFRSLTPENTERNPYFYEFWETKKKCRLEKYPLTPNNKNFTSPCTGLIPEKDYMQKMPSAQLVRDAVYAVATALDDMHKDRCKGEPGLCESMSYIDGKDLKEYLYKAKFHDVNGNLFQFDSSGDAPPRYSIANFQKREGSDDYYWRPIGTFIKNGDDPAELVLDRTKMKFKHYEPEFPNSVCSTPCLAGQTKVLLDTNKCCWSCFNCTKYEYMSEDGTCRECSLGYLPSKNMTFCEPVRVRFMTYSNSWAKGCIIFAVLGILATIAMSVVFGMYWDTPIIKASARELSVLLLLGILLSYVLTFAIVTRPTMFTCGLVRFFLGFTYTMCYAAIVIKTRRIARIFERRGRRHTKYTSPQSQLMLAGVLLSVEAVINATWLMYDVPSVTNQFPRRDKNVLVCGGSETPSYLLGLLYPFLLMIVCTVYAFKTRKCPDGFNEARHITFANYTTCVIWLAFLPTYILHDSNTVRTATLSLLLSCSGTIQIACLFVPKAYIAILQPHNNTKDNVMGHTGLSSSATTST